MDKIKIGFIVTGATHFGIDLPRRIKQRSLEFLNTLKVDVIPADDIVLGLETLAPAVEKFKVKGIELLILQNGAFTWDNIPIYIAKELPNVPLMMWAVPEPPMDGGSLTVNSYCATTMNGCALAKMGKEFKFVYGMTDDKRLVDTVKQQVRLIRLMKKLNKTKLGLVGYRPPGFYSSCFNELELRKILGIEIIHLSLVEIMDEYNSVDIPLAKEDLKKVLKGPGKLDKASEVALLEMSKLYLGVKSCIQNKNLQAIAMKCWPELLGKNLSPCFVNSRLNNEGIPASCEADVNGAITQIIQYYLTDSPTFFCDLVNFNEEKNTALMWHCGSAASKLAKKGCEMKFQTHSIVSDSVTFEFPLKAGRITLARLGEIDGRYRMFIVTGEAIDTEMCLRGNPIRVKYDCDVRRMIEYIIEKHIEHHYSLVYGDIKDDLIELCKMKKIEVMTV